MSAAFPVRDRLLLVPQEGDAHDSKTVERGFDCTGCQGCGLCVRCILWANAGGRGTFAQAPTQFFTGFEPRQYLHDATEGKVKQASTSFPVKLAALRSNRRRQPGTQVPGTLMGAANGKPIYNNLTRTTTVQMNGYSYKRRKHWRCTIWRAKTMRGSRRSLTEN